MLRWDFLLLLGVVVGLPVSALSATPPAYAGFEPDGSPESLYRLDQLAFLRSGTVCRMFSSYDREGGNDDGFYGTYSKLREENGDSVIAEMKGRGCIQRIWFTHSIMAEQGLLDRKGEHIRIFLDGNAKPAVDVPLEKLFSGEFDAFPKPLVGSGLGGYYCYVPIPYNNGCKVVIEGTGVRFYQITYNEFAHSRPFDSLSMDLSPSRRDALRQAVQVWSHPGDLEKLELNDASTRTHEFRLAGGGASQSWDLPEGPRIIRALELRSADTTRTLQARLRVFWDGADSPAIDAPLGLFFGQAPGTAPFRSLLLGDTGDELYTFFPMPYAREARVAVESADPVTFSFTIVSEHADFASHRYGYFHALYIEELPTELGLHYPWLNIDGSGHFAGLVLATEGRQSEPIWLEGDDKFIADDELVIHGTGSEDYFNCGWYAVPSRLDHAGAFPQHGFPVYDRKGDISRAVAYRWHLTDPVVFKRSLNARIEHGPQNDIAADYRSVTFYYHADPEQQLSKADIPVGDECIDYLRECTWQLAAGDPDRALERLQLLLEKAPRPIDRLLIESVSGYVRGRRDADPCALLELQKAIKNVDALIEEQSENEIPGHETEGSESAVSVPAASGGAITPSRLREIQTLLKRAELDLERHVALSDGIDPGESFILEARDIYGETLLPPTYEESEDFRGSFAKVDDLQLLGKGARFTWGRVPQSWARFTPGFPRDGYYQVRVIFSFGANAGDTKYVVRHADGITTVPLAQRGRPGTRRRNNDKWINLGVYRFNQGQGTDTGSVTLVAGPGREQPNPDIEYRAYSDSMMFEYLWRDLLERSGDTLDDFESGDLRNWTVLSGDLHTQPVRQTRRGIEVGQQGDYFIGTTETGGTLPGDYDDTLQGALESKSFRPQKNFITFLIGGGNDKFNLYLALVDAETGSILRRTTGKDGEAMERKWWEVAEFEDRYCRLEIVDHSSGEWGHINVDDIRETDDIDQTESEPLVVAGKFFRIYDPSVGEEERWYINDHCFVPAENGEWHLFGITHEEPASAINEDDLAHAISRELTAFPWTKQPFALSTIEDSWEEIHLWAPHAVRHNGTYYMFYCAGDADPTRYKIHLATSTDLRTWTRHPENPVVVDGYRARDPMVLRVGDQWVMYYTANSEPSGGNHIVACRTSDDLIHWGERGTVFTDPTVGKGGGPTESPFVLRRGRFYYLFLGPRGGYAGTDVFQSTDPFKFELDRLVGHVNAHAAEVIRDRDGRWYVSHCGWDEGGVYLAPLFWNDGQDNPDTSLPVP